MNKRMNKNMSVVLSTLMVASSFAYYAPVARASEVEDLQLSLTPKPNIDIALSLGETNVDGSNFESDIKSALDNKGVDISKVNVSAIETSSLSTDDADAEMIFADWTRYGYNSNTWSFNSSQKYITRQNNDWWSGFYDPKFDSSDYTLEVDMTSLGSDDDDIGITFGMKDGEVGSYAYILSGNSGRGFSYSNQNTHIHGHATGLYKYNGTTITGLVSDSNRKFITNNWTKFKLIVKGKNAQIWIDGNKIIDFNAPEELKGSFGFFTNSQPEGTFKNLKVTSKQTKQFREVIREPVWRDGSLRFLVNMEDKENPDFNNSVALGEILPRLINEEIHYIGAGTSANRNQSLSLIDKNNDQGIFSYNTNYNQSINEIAEYIKNQIKIDEGESQYVLVGEPIDIQVSPASLAKNTQTPEYPLGRWRIDHDYDFYENHLGQASWANQWQKDLQMVFDKPGKYEIRFGEEYPNPRYIYAHRRPVASFSTIVKDNGSSFGIATNDYSYDLDMETSSDKGIVEREWKWRKTTDSNWTNGKIPSSLPIGQDYIVQLRVKDHQGVWSVPESRYITTADVVARPVANFNATPNPVTMYENLIVEDMSYDPAGRSINEKTWTVTKNGTEVYKGSTPLTNFRTYGEGTYKITLKVKNSQNLWSEEFTRTVTVTADKEAPEAIVSPTSRSWSQDNVSINVTYTDKGGSGFKHQRYAVTTSATPPTSGWSTYSPSTSRSVTISTEGKNYLHIESEDNVGNKTTRTIGEYQIDRTAPGMNHTLSPASWHNDEVVIQATGTDSDSGVKSIKLPNGNKVFATNISYAVEANGDYEFEIEDNAGNKSTKTVKVSTIDKINPSATHTVEHVDGDTYKITLKGGDDVSGVKRIKLPNGQYQNGATATFNGLKDQTYTFEVEDNAGNKLPYNVKISAPNLNVYQTDNHVKAEWAIEMLNEDVMYQTSFESGDELPNLIYSNGRTGGQSFDSTQSFSGSRSLKVSETIGENGNYYHGKDLFGNDLGYTDYSYATFSERKYVPNGTDLSLSFVAKTTGMASMMATAQGGSADFGKPTAYKFTQKVNVGDKTVKVDDPQFFKNYVDRGNRFYIALMKGRYSYGYPISVDMENSTITLNTGFRESFEAGEPILQHQYINPGTFSARNVNGETGWTLYNMNIKVADNMYYDTSLRGFALWLRTTAHKDVYIDDVKMGYATKAQLFRGDTKIYEGLLSDYEDREATDKAKPDKVTVANVSAKNGSVFMDIVKPNDNGTAYGYTVRALSNKGDWVESEKKEVTVTSEIEGYSYVIDNQAGTIPDNTIDSRSEKVQIPITSNAQYYIHVKAIDEAGNVSDVTHIPFRDATAPIMELSQNPTSWTAGNVVIQAQATDESLDMKRIKLPNGTWVNGDSASYTVTANGTYTFIAEDLVGNQSTKSITITNIDKTNPTAPTINNNEEWVKADSMSVTILAGTDGASGVKRVEYKLEGATSQNWTTYTGTFNIRNEGETKVLARTIDNVGHASDESTSFVRLDRSAPYNMGITIKLKP